VGALVALNWPCGPLVGCGYHGTAQANTMQLLTGACELPLGLVKGNGGGLPHLRLLSSAAEASHDMRRHVQLGRIGRAQPIAGGLLTVRRPKDAPTMNQRSPLDSLPHQVVFCTNTSLDFFILLIQSI
jgi:hypothetical protein